MPELVIDGNGIWIFAALVLAGAIGFEIMLLVVRTVERMLFREDR